jgi:hypothetical protein
MSKHIILKYGPQLKLKMMMFNIEILMYYNNLKIIYYIILFLNNIIKEMDILRIYLKVKSCKSRIF